MLLQFKFKNHKCFYDETILDLTATQEQNQNNFLINAGNLKVLPVVSIHGANASGKTTVIDALHFMFSIIGNSTKFDIQKDLIYFPFLFSEEYKNENSEYEVSICIDNFEYRYGFSMNKNAFEEEWFYVKKVSKYETVQKIIFERYKDKVTFGNTYEKYEKIWNLFGLDAGINTNKMLVLSTIAIRDEDGPFRNVYEFICKSIFRKEDVRPSVTIELVDKESIIYNKFMEIVKEFDPCLLGINIEEIENNSQEIRYSISGIHRDINNPDNEIYLPLINESFGTIKIFNVLPRILLNLENGGILCIDELDTKLHPLLFKKIVNMYKDKNLNKKNAQLIFTAHSTFLFNSSDLRRDQIYLVEKNKLGISKLYSLSEFRNLRVDADYAKKYLTGQFGAIPFID